MQTELDRNIIEAIKDPLTHLVRNAIDHGIEGPEVRPQAGKDPAGKLRRVMGSYVSEHMITEVLDVPAILRRAIPSLAECSETAAAAGFDGAVDPVDISLHIHADAAPGNVGDFFGGGKTGQKNQVENVAIGHLGGLFWLEQSSLHGLFSCPSVSR